MSWGDLEKTTDAGIRFCDRCQENVHLAKSNDEFARFASEGKCVAIEIEMKMELGIGSSEKINYSDE